MAELTSSAGLADVTENNLSAPGQYAFAGLAANILAQLYGDDDERAFRHKLMAAVGKCIEASEAVMLAHIAVADGEYQTDNKPLIDLLLEEEMVKEQPQPLLSRFLMAAIADGVYDARVRVVLEHMCWLLRVDMKLVEDIEDHILALLRCSEELSAEEKQKAAKKARNTKIGRGIAIGLATVVGGTVVGVTGGLAAPLIATGLGAFIGTAGGAALASATGIAVISSLFGAAGAGLVGYKMKKRVGGIEQFEFDVLTAGSQMSMTIAISGWITSTGEDDFRKPWLTLDNSKEQYYLKYEGHYLQTLGKSLDTLSTMAVTQAVTETLKYTALHTLIAAIAWPSAMLALASVIDNPWHVCTKRAENAGKQLAEVLLSREQGQRPVTLIGFSLGARVIFYCLRALAAHPRGAGIVENAYLLGAPVPGNAADWQPFSKVIAGKIVNAYIRSDWILKFLYRTASAQRTIAGTGPVEWHDRRMINMDLTNAVTGHMDYMKKMTTVLEAVGIHTKATPSVFTSHSDRSRSPSPLPTEAAPDCQPLLVVSNGADNVEQAPEPPAVALNVNGPETRPEEPSALPYKKLQSQDSTLSALSTSAHLLISQGETTDSDKSLPDSRHYEQLIEQGSSQDCVPNNSKVQAKHKVVKIPVTKAAGSEKLLGHISTNERLLSDGSNDSILSAGHTSDLSFTTALTDLSDSKRISTPVPSPLANQEKINTGCAEEQTLVTSKSDDDS